MPRPLEYHPDRPATPAERKRASRERRERLNVTIQRLAGLLNAPVTIQWLLDKIDPVGFPVPAKRPALISSSDGQHQKFPPIYYKITRANWSPWKSPCEIPNCVCRWTPPITPEPIIHECASDRCEFWIVPVPAEKWKVYEKERLAWVLSQAALQEPRLLCETRVPEDAEDAEPREPKEITSPRVFTNWEDDEEMQQLRREWSRVVPPRTVQPAVSRVVTPPENILALRFPEVLVRQRPEPKNWCRKCQRYRHDRDRKTKKRVCKPIPPKPRSNPISPVSIVRIRPELTTTRATTVTPPAWTSPCSMCGASTGKRNCRYCGKPFPAPNRFWLHKDAWLEQTEVVQIKLKVPEYGILGRAVGQERS